MISLILGLFHLSVYSQTDTTFYSKNHIPITLKSINDFEKVEIRISNKSQVQLIEEIDRSITDKETYFAIADYNFDGYKDFSCCHIDDGMGVYTVYQIFIYNPKTNLFNELQIPYKVYPNCEMFCDVKLDKKRKRLLSSCRGGARWHTDSWTFDKYGKLKLLKN